MHTFSAKGYTVLLRTYSDYVEIEGQIRDIVIRHSCSGCKFGRKHKFICEKFIFHSIPVDVELKEQKPPEFLYHGTAVRFLDKIMNEGLKPMSRLYVYLSKDADTAMKVGKRHGKPVILKIHSRELYRDGSQFYLSENDVWSYVKI